MEDLTVIKDQAYAVHHKILASIQIAQQSIYDIGTSLKTMRDDKLYKEFGYPNFESYCEKEIGFSRGQVHKYISIVEHLPQDFVSPVKQMGMHKLYLLSSLSESERTEIVENNDLESVTVKELNNQIKALKEQNSSDKQKAQQKQIDLEKQIKELENRPTEIITQKSDELPEGAIDKVTFENICKEYDDQIEQMQEDDIKSTRGLHQKYNAEIEELKKQIDKLSQNNTSNNIVEVADPAEYVVNTYLKMLDTVSNRIFSELLIMQDGYKKKQCQKNATEKIEQLLNKIKHK